MAEMTPADVVALSRDNTGFMGGGCGFFWIVVLFLIFGMMGGGMWGNNAALQGALTRGDLADGFNAAEIQRNQIDNIRDTLTNRYEVARMANDNQREILENRFATQIGFTNAQAQMAQCCCDIKTAVHAEGEATRNLIQQNLLDQYRQDLQAAQLQLGNVAQTQTLLAALSPQPKPAWIVNSPYVGYTLPQSNSCGCYNA